jgi:hypothetical protein
MTQVRLVPVQKTMRPRRWCLWSDAAAGFLCVGSIAGVCGRAERASVGVPTQADRPEQVGAGQRPGVAVKATRPRSDRVYPCPTTLVL